MKWRTLLLLSLAVLLAKAVWFSASAVVPALTLQTSLGFLLTLLTIRLSPALESWVGWHRAFMFLAISPVIGIWAMYALRRSSAAARLAGGKR